MTVIFKPIGALALLAAAVVWGFGRIRSERRTTEQIAEMCALVGFIRDNVVHFNRPLPDIYADYYSRLLDDCGFIAVLRSRGLPDALECLSIADDEIARQLRSFAERIGTGYTDETTELCEYTLARIEPALEKRRGAAHDRERLYRTMPILLALAAIMMFI